MISPQGIRCLSAAGNLPYWYVNGKSYIRTDNTRLPHLDVVVNMGTRSLAQNDGYFASSSSPSILSVRLHSSHPFASWAPFSRDSICWVKDIPWWKEGSNWWDEGQSQFILSRLRLLYLMRCNSWKKGYFCLTTESLLRQSGWMFWDAHGHSWYTVHGPSYKDSGQDWLQIFIWGNVVPVDSMLCVYCILDADTRCSVPHRHGKYKKLICM